MRIDKLRICWAGVFVRGTAVVQEINQKVKKETLTRQAVRSKQLEGLLSLFQRNDAVLHGAG